jgi:hypothetical protein
MQKNKEKRHILRGNILDTPRRKGTFFTGVEVETGIQKKFVQLKQI